MMPPPTPLFAGDRIGADNALTIQRIDTAIGQGRRHQREIARGDEHRALAEIHIEHGIDIAFDDPIIAQEIGNSAVAVARELLGREYRFIDVKITPCKTAERVADVLRRVFTLSFMDQSGAGNSAGIDHGVKGPVVNAQPNGVEGISARLNADRGCDPVWADKFERERKRKGFGDRLDRERHGGVADRIDMAIDRRERDAEMARIGPEQLGYIIGKRATLLERKRCMGLREKLRKWVNGCDTGLSACRPSSKDIHADTVPFEP